MKIAQRAGWVVAGLALVATAMPLGAQAGPKSGRVAAKFHLVYDPAGDPTLEHARTLAKATGTFEDIVQGLNETLALPSDIVIRFASDPRGPYYQDGQIVMSYEFLALHAYLFTEFEYVEDDDELADAILDVTEYVLYHELAHALIDAYGIPILGREEDAADNLAVLVSTYLDVGEIALVAADAIDLGLELQEDTIDEAEFWDTHSLDEQRVYSAICLVFGSDPKRYSGLLREEGMPREKREECLYLFEKKREAWLAVLQPYLKQAFFE